MFACLAAVVGVPVADNSLVKLPWKLVQDEETAEKWKQYQEKVKSQSTLYPIDMSEDDIFYTNVMQEMSLEVPELKKYCFPPLVDGDWVAWLHPYADAESTILRYRSSYTGIESNEWVEVTHADVVSMWHSYNADWFVDTMVAPTKWESSNTWYFKAKGSGNFYNVGNTMVFNTHVEAADYFNLTYTDTYNPFLNDGLTLAALREGLDSIQFLDRREFYCGLRNIGHEIVDFREGCPLVSLDGSPCNCNKTFFTCNNVVQQSAPHFISKYSLGFIGILS